MKNDAFQPNDLVISGRHLRVRTGGSGPALLLIHSAWGDAELSWASVWNGLGAAFTVIAPDLPGFGASDAPRSPSLNSFAGTLLALLDHLRIERTVVAGNSFGAAVAIEFASASPSRARHLAMVNGGSLPALPRFIKGLMTAPFLEVRLRALMRRMTYSGRAFTRAFPDPSRLPPGFFERIRKDEARQARIVFDAFMNQERPQVPPKTPATIIWGTGDRLVSLRQADILRKRFGDPAFIRIEGAGHMPQVERPDEFVAAMERLRGE